ncbi:hypothetical protein [Paramicrobacterium chengjingii]|uniref:Uncharacterized protein n=1 Tax=Paramicrobacterium chengjingii TaxID=2769067 RepID=A0ABX6YLY5_9MICO|nr:hypothetical protein [Microbacterium chengjingii]QPZ39732.1 hypothetical protein HCR76_06715 [Microbacterium chengjingii]
MTDQSDPDWADEFVPIPTPRHEYPRMRNRDPDAKVATFSTAVGALVIIGIVIAVWWVVGA